MEIEVSFMKKIFALVLLPLLFSCTSLQQDVNIEQVSYSAEVLSFEERFAFIDADSFLPATDSEAEKENRERVEKFVSDIDKALEDNSVQKASRARLFALAGKAYLVSGSKSKASAMYEKSVSEYKGDTQGVILAHRLGLLSTSNIEEKVNEVSERNLLVLERAINLFQQKRYADSVAKFDESFLSLAEFYQAAYGKIRNLSWNFRNIDADSDSAELLSLPEITVSQMLSIAKGKSDFLYNLAGGKKMSDREFYYKVSSTGLLDSVSAESPRVESDEKASKYLSARFLWNLYNARKKSANPKKYSEKFKKSPVMDLQLDSPDFDAVLGCVEGEFMSLEDGRNFYGEKTVSGTEFDSYVEKMENAR